MKNLLIVDFEATCFMSGKEPPDFFQEIIEIGAVLLDTATRLPAGEYQTFVKPVLFPTLSPFCIKLTSIQQQDVDAGLSFDEAVQGLAGLWDHESTVFASWGFYDQRQLERQCQRFGVAYPFAEQQHISVKHEHAQLYKLKKPLGMSKALELHQIPLTGTHHRGIDDARNIAHIAARMLDDGWTHPLLVV
jgi:inhibitor of KinA sporulation pathway (predicted exonuclease)